MATHTFTLKSGTGPSEVKWDKLALASPAGLQAGVAVDLAVSEVVPNTFDDSSLKLVLDFSDLTPNQASFRIAAIVESQDPDTGSWHRIAHQNDAYYRADIGPTREIILQPDLLILDVGLDDIVYVADEEMGHISRHQGKLPADGFRVRLIIKDYNAGGASCFQSVAISGYGEMY